MTRGNGAGWSDWLRWSFAAGVIVAGAGSAIAGVWETCKAVTPNTGAEGVVRVCDQPSLADVPSVAGLLIVLLLLLPDLAEITLPGGIGLKRRIEAQEARQDLLQQQIAMLTHAESYAQAASVGNVLSLEGLNEMIEGVVATRIRLRELEGAAPDEGDVQKLPRPVEVRPETVMARERAELTNEIDRLTGLEPLDLQRELVRRWRAIAPLVRLADFARPGTREESLPDEVRRRLTSMSDAEIARLLDWRDAYGETIGLLDETRRTIVSDPQALGQEELATVSALARELEASAKDLRIV
jgi:hypothetical protein